MTATFPEHRADTKIFLVSAIGSVLLHGLIIASLTFLPEARILEEESPTVQVTFLPAPEASLAPPTPTPPLQPRTISPKATPPPLPQAQPHRSRKLVTPLRTTMTPSAPLTPSPLPPPVQAKPILKDTRASQSMTVKNLMKMREPSRTRQASPAFPTVPSRTRPDIPQAPPMPLLRNPLKESQSLPAPPMATKSQTMTASPPVHTGSKTTKPTIIKSSRPLYPRVARESGWEGTVIVRTLIMPDGKPSELKIRQSCGHASLDEAALDAVRNWTFRPAKDGNIPISKWVDIPIKFDLNS